MSLPFGSMIGGESVAVAGQKPSEHKLVPLKLVRGGHSMHTLRYSFEPDSIDKSRGAVLSHGSGEKTIVFGHQHNVSSPAWYLSLKGLH